MSKSVSKGVSILMDKITRSDLFFIFYAAVFLFSSVVSLGGDRVVLVMTLITFLGSLSIFAGRLYEKKVFHIFVLNTIVAVPTSVLGVYLFDGLIAPLFFSLFFPPVLVMVSFVLTVFGVGRVMFGGGFSLFSRGRKG